MTEIKHKIFGSVGNSQENIQQPEVRQMNRNDLKSLIELGCIRDEITIEDKVFVIRTLNSAERMSLSKFLGDSKDIDRLFEFNNRLLAMAIETVNGVPLENFHTDTEGSPFDKRIDILSVMQTSVITALLSFYNKIAERGDAKFSIEEIKN